MLSSCFSENYQEGPFKAPSNRYFVIAKVNQSNEKLDNYADVRLFLLDQQQQVIDSVNSGAGDFSRWAAGWMSNADTVVLFSSDIGTSAWRIKDGRFEKLPLEDDTVRARGILQRAVYLKGLKYDK